MGVSGVSLLDCGGELTASVTVPSASRLLGFSAAFVSFPGRNPATVPERIHISVALCLPRPVPLRARSSGRAGASGTLRPPENLAWGAQRLGFWGAIRDCSSTYVFFLVADPVFFPVIAYGTANCLLPGDPFVGLHCEHLPASTVVDDFEQRTMSTSANGASDALGIGPSAGYSLISMIIVFIFLL